ncbi:MAG: glycosyltransferase [Gemmatimonadaceae bacterium]
MPRYNARRRAAPLAGRGGRKIGIYLEPSAPGAALGGGSYTAAILVATLGRLHHMEIVHHNPSLTLDRLSAFAGADLGDLRLRHIEKAPRPDATHRNLWRRYQEQRCWSAALSEPYDLFINLTHGIPPFCHAARGALIVLFPEIDRARLWPWSYGAPAGRWLLRRQLRGAYYDWEWERRFGSYQVKASISRFAQQWTKHWWGIDSAVVYPPVDTRFSHAEKSDLILSVGRFTASRRSKLQLEMATAFGELERGGMRGWEYISAGALGVRHEDRAYFEQVGGVAAGRGVRLIANIERAHLRSLYARAKVFWHAAGYGADATASPQFTEHFGIVTVEAMAAGCVPVVINRGGQPEIVEHGVSGFLWDTLDELGTYTQRLASDDALRARMADAARARARHFDRDEFATRVTRLVGPLL